MTSPSVTDDGVIERLTRDYCAVLGSSVTIGSGSIAGNVITLFKNVRDIDQDASKTYVESFFYDQNKLLPVGAPLEVVKMAFYDASPSGKTISLKYGKDEIPLVEVKSPNGSHLINVGDTHGKFVSDNWFSDGVSWSSDEKYVIYIALSKEKKKNTFFHEESIINRTLEHSVVDQPIKGTKYSYTEDWGEKYVNTSSTCIAIVDVISGVVKLIPLLEMDDYTIGQAQFVPNTSRIVFTAWFNSPRKLGMIYCYNRKCCIYITEDTSEILSAANSTSKVTCKNLTSTFALARSPRFNKSGGKLTFLGNKSGYSSHNGAQTLYYIPKAATTTTSFDYDDEPIEVLPIVNVPSSSSDFPGIYSNGIPRNGHVSDDEVVLNTVWGSVDSIILVSLSTKSVTRLSLEITRGLGLDNPNEWNNATDYSLQVLDVNGDNILFTYSSPSMTQQFGIYDRVQNIVTTAVNDNHYCIKWKLPSKSVDSTHISSLKASVRSIRWKIFNFNDSSGIPYDGVLILPPASSTPLLPGVIVPHGGPHSNFSTSFIAGYAYLVLTLNVAVVYINYRGSTGFGQDSINSLLGNIGTNDVNDTKYITDFLINEGFLDRHRIGIVGGSHGGFLGAHMIGQFPSVYKVAALRNPVINIPQMVGTTDIPDWCYVEAGLTYNFADANLPSIADIERMHMVSPVTHVSNITAPVLLCLGAKDRRVPYTQGLEYAQLLKAKGVKVSMLVFPEDCHALDKPMSEADQWVAIALHLHTYI